MTPMLQLDEDLVDQVRSGVLWAYRSWEPDCITVVLGRGNNAAVEIHEHRCREDQVPVLRRRGGGGTVVLCPGILVISLVKWVKHQYDFKEYFQQINEYLIESLQSLGIRDLNQQGHSDICIRDRKVLGSSMYRSKNLLFYTASLMVSNNLNIIDRYLKHPSREPEYRRGRSHQEFLTTISREYPDITVETVKSRIDGFCPKWIPEIE
jgi:lipoate-protein ligase A